MMKKIDKLRMSRYAMVWGMLFSALWLFAVAPLQAQTEQDKVLAEQGTKTQVHQEAKKIFVNMPDSLSPLLTAVNRADCIDFLESKMKAKVENRFGRESEMTELSKDYIRVQMTPQSTWQMKLLATSDTTQVICTVSTACAPVCDSNIQFYTTDWKELPISDFITAMPAMDDFFEKIGVRKAGVKLQLLAAERRFHTARKVCGEDERVFVICFCGDSGRRNGLSQRNTYSLRGVVTDGEILI